MRKYRYTATEHDLRKPWVVIGQHHLTVELDDDASFFEWAHEHWREPQFTVELDPWQLGVGLQTGT